MKKEDNRCFTIDGTKLKNKRQEMNLTQEKLAQITNPNIDVSTLRRNEHPGPHNMFVATVVAIATALHCAPTELFYEDTTLSSAADEPVCERDIFKADQEDTGSDALITTELHMLTLSPYADEPLKMASAGLLKASGSRERVSVSIASIAGYMRSIIWRAPALMNHVQGLIEATTSALSASKLDDESTILALRTGLKNNMAELRGIEGLPVHAKMESELVVGLLVRSQMTNDVAEQLRAVKYRCTGFVIIGNMYVISRQLITHGAIFAVC